MVHEALGFVATVLVLGLIGLGPALWLVTKGGAHRLRWATGIAPTIGLGLVGLLGFPLIRWVAPAQRWALPLTLVLVIVSLVLVLWDARRNRSDYRDAVAGLRTGRLWTAAVVAVLFLAVLAILAAPLVVGGIDYAAFRGNPSDAYTYVSVAETFRTVDWQSLREGALMRDLPAVQRLAAASPTALFTARFVLLPIRLMTQVPLAWASQLWGIPVYRFLYAYELVSFALGFLLALVVAGQLRLGRRWALVGALAVTLGFWARYLLEIDAAARATLVPVFLLLAFAWIQLEQTTLRPLGRERVLLGLSAAMLAAFYPQAVPLVVLAFVFYYGLGLLQGVVSWRPLLYHFITLALAAVFMVGYLDFAARTLLWQTPVVVGDTSALTNTDALHFLRTDGPAALWGLPVSILVSGAPRVVNWGARGLFAAAGLLLTLLFLWGVLRAMRKPRREAQQGPDAISAFTGLRVLVALIASGFVVAVLMFVAGTLWASGRAVTYVYPFMVLALLAILRDAGAHWRPRLATAAVALTSVWLVIMILVGATLPINRLVQGDAFSAGGMNKPENYDLSRIVTALRQLHPSLLVVDIQRTDNWVFPYYTTYIFKEFPTYFLSGLIYDNSTNYRNLWLDALPSAPDYAVVRKNDDFIAARKLGELVAETEDLALYRIKTQNVSLFDQRQAILQQREAGKLSFPGLESAPN